MHLTIDIDVEALSGDPAAEIGRILRYWAGAMKQIELSPGLEHELMDSEYRPVGKLAVTAEND
jgi:hypothetical protein